MISNILPIVAFAGAAMAACPLSVEIVGASDHVAQVAVTNTGTEILAVFKGNTVFSEHDTKDLVATTADGKVLPFEGAYVNYKKTGLPASAFQILAPGQTVTTEVNAAKTYKLAGIDTAIITATQGFRYAAGDVVPTSLKGLASCEAQSKDITIIPNQEKVAEEHITKRGEFSTNSRIMKRSITFSGCTSSQTSTLKTSISDAISMSSAAYTAANTGLYYFANWFRTATSSQESKVRTIYNDVVGVQTTSPKIYCNDQFGDCADGSALLYTVPSANSVVPCPNNGFWDFPVLATTCADDDYDKAGSLLHEFTHLYGTGDYAYGSAAALKLSASQAASNADTYEMYAGSVRLRGCAS